MDNKHKNMPYISAWNSSKIWAIWNWKEVIKSYCGYTTARKKVFIQMCWASPFLKFVQELTDNIESFERETAKDSRAGYAV